MIDGKIITEIANFLCGHMATDSAWDIAKCLTEEQESLWAMHEAENMLNPMQHEDFARELIRLCAKSGGVDGKSCDV